MKQCRKCNELKSLNQYAKDSIKKDGLRSICKVCDALRKKEIYHSKQLVTEIKIQIKLCITCDNSKNVTSFDKDKRSADGVAWECKECRHIRYKSNYSKHSEKRRKKSSKYYHNNKEKALACNLKYQNKREKKDILYRLTRRLRNRLYYALKRAHWKTDTHFSEYIGCTLEALKSHLQAKFTEGMTWDNWGLGEKCWVIDHIYPLSLAKTEEEMLKLCHYTNLQPMWFIPNIKKSNKV